MTCLEFAEGQLLVLALPHRFDAAEAQNNSGASEEQPRRWRLARREPALPRRRQAPAGAAASPGARGKSAAAGDQRGAVPPSRPPPAAGRADLHPREDDDRRHRQAARGQCRALSETGPRNGAAVPRYSRGDRGNHALCRPHQLLARPAQIPVSGRAGAAGQDRAAASGRPDLGRRRQIFRRRDQPTRCAPPCAKNSR